MRTSDWQPPGTSSPVHLMTTHETVHHDASTSRTIILCTLSVFALVSTSGNLLIFVSSVTSRHLKHRSNVIFAALAGTNFLYALFPMTFNIIYNSMEIDIFPSFVIYIFQILDDLFCTASNAHLVAIAMDRFMNIFSPLTHARKFSSKVYGAVISVLWFLSALAVFMPITFGCHKTLAELPSHTHRSHTNITERNLDCCYRHSPPVCAISQAFLSFVIPFFFMFVIYTRMFMITRSHLRHIRLHKLSEDFYGENPAAQLNPRRSYERESPIRQSQSSPSSSIELDIIDEQYVPEYITSTAAAAAAANIDAQSNDFNSRRYHSVLEHSNKGTLDSVVPIRTSRSFHARNSLSVSSKFTNEQMPRKKRSSQTSGISKLSALVNTIRINAKVQTHYKAALSLGLIFGSFLLCWLPYFLLSCIASFGQCVTNELMFAATWLGYSNSCLNPIVYAILNSRFRRSFVRVMRDLPRKRRRSEKYGIARLRFASEATIRLAIGRIPSEHDDGERKGANRIAGGMPRKRSTVM